MFLLLACGGPASTADNVFMSLVFFGAFALWALPFGLLGWACIGIVNVLVRHTLAPKVHEAKSPIPAPGTIASPAPMTRLGVATLCAFVATLVLAGMTVVWPEARPAAMAVCALAAALGAVALAKARVLGGRDLSAE